uniref:Uncharacterized protein n=1 Tax=viral metagenome TaxID=1070528 RepID=A0A6C0BKW3_9ZZZZ
MLNLTGSDYLSQHPDDAKMILCCGHLGQPPVNTINGLDPNTDLLGRFLHTHSGWYTVDRNPSMKPDFVADLENVETQTTLRDVFHHRLKVIYLEGWQFFSPEFHRMAYDLLDDHCWFIYSVGHNTCPELLHETQSCLQSAGFPTEQIHWWTNPLDEALLRLVRQGLQRHPPVKSIQEVKPDILHHLMLVDADPLERFHIKINYASGVISHCLTQLAKLSQIDPFLGWGLSFAYDRKTYVMAQK